MNMYQLFADSTFCFLNINGKLTGFRIQHDDRYSGIILKSDSLSRTINNESFYYVIDKHIVINNTIFQPHFPQQFSSILS